MSEPVNIFEQLARKVLEGAGAASLLARHALVDCLDGDDEEGITLARRVDDLARELEDAIKEVADHMHRPPWAEEEPCSEE